jgi:gliding motility-associated-like protein
LQKIYFKVGLVGILFSFFFSFLPKSSAQCGGVDFTTATKRKGCIPLVVFFQATGTSSAAGTNFRWDLGSGFLSGKNYDTISRIYTASGQYRIKMEATLSGSSTPCTVVKDTFITVLPSPLPVMWVSSGNQVCDRSQPVTFVDTTPGSVKREWIVDGNSFNTQTLVYTFPSTGTHQVSLSVTNKYGCSGFITQNINVYDSVMLDICMVASINKAASSPLIVALSPRVGNTYPRKIISYNWYMPGGSPSSYSTTSTKGFLVNYPDITKKYDVSLTIVMDDGCSYTMYRKGFVSPFITPTFQTKCAGRIFTVNSDLSDTGRHRYQFGFPGASVIDLGSPPPLDPKIVKIQYDVTGNYNAIIKYQYNTPLACTITINYTNIFTVLGPKANFESKNNQVCKPTDTVRLHNTSDIQGATGVKYTWYFYDSLGKKLLKTNNKLGPATNADTFYVPGISGKISVGLVATSTNGCSDSIVIPAFITVASPKADFVSGTPIGCFGSTMALTAKPTPQEGKIVKYKYNWVVVSETDTNSRGAGTGNVYSFPPPLLGKYDVSLTVSNGNCSSDTIKKGFLTVIGDNTDVVIKDHNGCLGPNFITTVSVGKEKIYPNDPFNPPTYHWRVNSWDAANVTFLDPYAPSTSVVITRSGCYDIILDIYTHLGKDTCKQTITKEAASHQGICVGAGLSYTVRPRKCLGDTIVVDNYSDAAAGNFKWIVTPKNLAKILPTDTSRNISIIFMADTCYQIELYGEKLINGSLCKDSSFDNSVCMIVPKADFTTSTPKFYCAPAIGRFKSTSKNAKSYFWFFDDGDSLYTKVDSVSHAYLTLKKGEYSIKLIAYDSNMCSSTIEKKNLITVEGPVPHFTMDKRVGCDSISVLFNNTSKNVNSFYFFYDDGSGTLANKNPGLHSYVLQDAQLDSVIYFPTMLSRDDTTCKVFYRDTIKLYRTPGDVVINANKTFGCVPMTVNFNAISRTATGWRWDFNGDGKIDDSLKKNPYYEFTKPGKYRVKLTVNNHGQCPSVFYSDTITVLPNAGAGFIPSQAKFCGKQEITFKNTTTDYKRFLFDYGDGSPWDSNVIAKHVYYFDPSRDKGDSVQFFPKLIAFNAAGCSDTFRLVLTSYAMPVAGFKSTVVAGCSPLKIQFTDTSQYSFGTQWDFENDGVIDAYGKIVDHIFTPGLYTVKMRSFSVHGCVDSIVKVNMINVNDPPISDFSVSDSITCFKAEVQFTNLTYPSAFVKKWIWKFNDPAAPYNTSTVKDPVFRFYSKGWHTVELTAVDDKGCTGYIKKQAVFVEDTVPPANTAMQLVTVDDTNSVTITWKKSNNALFKGYRLNRIINGKAVVVYNTSNPDDTVFTDNNQKINTSGLNYCYSIQTVNSCGHVSFASYSHCTILLSESALAGPANLLSWTSYIGWGPRVYRIYRSGKDGKMRLIDSVGGSTLSYTDTALCDETYCYYVEAVKGNNEFISKSNITCLHAVYVRQNKAPNLRYVTDVNDNAVKIQWDTVFYKNMEGYLIDRYNKYTGWIQDYAETKSNTYIDNNVDINNISYSYTIKTRDNCGYTGPQSNPGSSILLHQDIQDDRVGLSWNDYVAWPGGVKYYKLQVQLKNKTFKTIATLNKTAYVDDSVYNTIDTAYCYRVVAYSNNNPVADSSVSNRTCAVLPSRIFVPNAFTPGNNDSINDVWKISSVSVYNAVGNNLRKFDVKVFNRWGSLVFETNDLHKGWDGRFKGDIVLPDVYIYLIDAEGIDGRNIHLKGNITVIK